MSINITIRHLFLAVIALCLSLSFSSASVKLAHAQATENFAIESEAVDQPAPKDKKLVDSEQQTKKFAVANEILELNPLDRTMTTTIDGLAQSVPANRRILFKSIMNRSIKIDRLNTAAQLAFAEIFTLDELVAMRDFYASKEGAAINEKMPQFEERIQPVIESMVQDAIYNIRNSNVDFSQ